MALNISAWSIRKPIPPLVFFVVLIVLGAVSLKTLPITQMPNIDIPIVTITIIQTGAAPSELETQVTKNVENAAAGVVGVKHITSSISDGVSVTTVEFQLETPADRAVNDIRNAMANIRSELPQSIEEPSIQRVDVEGMAIVTYAASIPRGRLSRCPGSSMTSSRGRSRAFAASRRSSARAASTVKSGYRCWPTG